MREVKLRGHRSVRTNGAYKDIFRYQPDYRSVHKARQYV